MSTIDSQLAAINASLGEILTAVQALSPAKAEDLTPVINAVAGVQKTADAIAQKLPVDSTSST